MTIKSYSDLNSLELDTLREIGSIGTGNAATALSSLIGQQVRIEMPEAAKTGDEVQPVKTAEETNAENSQNQQKLEGKPADEAPADETLESAEAVAAESPNEDEMRGGSSFDRK